MYPLNNELSDNGKVSAAGSSQKDLTLQQFSCYVIISHNMVILVHRSTSQIGSVFTK